MSFSFSKYSGSKSAICATLDYLNEETQFNDFDQDNLSDCKHDSGLEKVRVLNNPDQSATTEISVISSQSNANEGLSGNEVGVEQYSILSLSNSGLTPSISNNSMSSDIKESNRTRLHHEDNEKFELYIKNFKRIDDWCLNNELGYFNSNNDLNLKENDTTFQEPIHSNSFKLSYLPTNSYHLYDSDLYQNIRYNQIISIKNFIKDLIPILRKCDRSVGKPARSLNYKQIPSVFSEKELFLFYSFNYDELNNNDRTTPRRSLDEISNMSTVAITESHSITQSLLTDSFMSWNLNSRFTESEV